MTAPKERPINFPAQLIAPTLAGTKTQHRVIVKDYVPESTSWFMTHGVQATGMSSNSMPTIEVPFRFGRVGDRLWVREAWAEFHDIDHYQGERIILGKDIVYRADGEGSRRHTAWKSSMHMPRWASRLTLEIVSVRVERIRSISVLDAIAEGVEEVAHGKWKNYMCSHPSENLYGNPACSYLTLRQKLYGKNAVDGNPWVFALEFRKVGSL